MQSRNSGDRWQAVHDAGTGSGIVALELSRHFKTVLGSDVVENSITVLRENISSRQTEGHANNEMLFEVRKAEEMDQWIEAESLDMVTMAEAIHWTTPSLVLSAAAKVLKPGGTLAIWNYGTRAIFEDNPVAEGIVERLLDAELRHVRYPNQQKADEVMNIMSTGLDTVEVDSKLFEEEMRWKWGGESKFSPPVRQAVSWDSAIGRNAKVHSIDSPALWGRQVDVVWFRGYLKTIHSNSITQGKAYDELWQELEHAMGGVDAKAKVSFPATLILARKRGSVS